MRSQMHKFIDLGYLKGRQVVGEPDVQEPHSHKELAGVQEPYCDVQGLGERARPVIRRDGREAGGHR